MDTSKNVGGTDRVARLAAGSVLVLFALLCPFAAAQGPVIVWGSGIVGAVLIVTGLVRVCPLYRMLGVCT